MLSNYFTIPNLTWLPRLTFSKRDNDNSSILYTFISHEKIAKEICRKEEWHCRKTFVKLLRSVIKSNQLYNQSRMYLCSFCYYCMGINFIQHKTNGGRQLDFLSRWCENSEVKLEERLSPFTENLKFITSHLSYKTSFSYFPLDPLASDPLEEKCIDLRN